MRGRYFCERCAVFGRGSECWACGSTDLVRSGPVLDAHVYGWEQESTPHRSGLDPGVTPAPGATPYHRTA